MNRIMAKRIEIINRILLTLEEAAINGKHIDMKQFELHICGEYGCTRRKAKEYLDVANAKVKFD